MKIKALCPRCRKRVSIKEPEFPFCSRRCRMIDLGRWLDERYCIEGEKASLSEQPGLEPDRDD